MLPRPLAKMALFAAVVPLLLGLPLARPPRAEEPRVIEIVSKRFQFAPNQLNLKKDEPVILRLHSEDVTHGFFMKQLGINTTIPPGTNTDVMLTPHEAGTFTVICHHFCGAGHGNMHMTIVVE
jgi:cytochrome c oxidase subunit II